LWLVQAAFPWTSPQIDGLGLMRQPINKRRTALRHDLAARSREPWTFHRTLRDVSRGAPNAPRCDSRSLTCRPAAAKGPGSLAAERNLQKRHKTGPQDRSPVPSRLRKVSARADFAGFSRECRRSQTAWRREGDLNPRDPSAFGLLKTPRVRPTILRSFSETSHREFIRHRFDTFKHIRAPQSR
jgi:hypothetical protein